jgi:hypothetical protein
VGNADKHRSDHHQKPEQLSHDEDALNLALGHGDLISDRVSVTLEVDSFNVGTLLTGEFYNFTERANLKSEAQLVAERAQRIAQMRHKVPGRQPADDESCWE